MKARIHYTHTLLKLEIKQKGRVRFTRINPNDVYKQQQEQSYEARSVK